MSTHDHPFGKPICIWNFTDQKKVLIDSEGLGNIFNHPEIKDRKVAIISLIGAFRSGKSFFLDYCLRFLYAHFPSINNPNKEQSDSFQKNPNWMGDEDEPLRGFSWSSATNRDTTGIVIWSDVFLHTMDKTGDKIAIIVMDTQGLYDKETTLHNNSRIFSLGTLICSIQVLNIANRIQEDHLQYLQFATEYARFAGVDSLEEKKCPFQKLLFLIRDWNNPEDHSYGIDGGNQYLEEIFKINQDEKSELAKVRQSISNSFEEIKCCVLPHPGRSVASSKEFDGRWAQMEADFKNELQNIVEHLLLPDNLTLKKINSNESSGSEICKYIESYFQLFESDEIPKVQNFFAATVKSSMNMLLEQCVNKYKVLIESKGLVKEEDILELHEECSTEIMKTFKMTKKMGDENHEQKYEIKLRKQINEIYEDWKKSQFETAEKMKAEEAMLKAEEAKEKAEQEKQRAEEAKLKAEEDKEKAEQEKDNANKAKLKAQEEKEQAEQAKQKAEEEKLKAEQEKEQAKLEKRKAEEEKQQAENERHKAIENQKQAEMENLKLEEINKKSEERVKQAESKAEQAENDKFRLIEEKNKIDEIKNLADARVKQAEQALAAVEKKLIKAEYDKQNAEIAKASAEIRAHQAEKEKQQAEQARLTAESRANQADIYKYEAKQSMALTEMKTQHVEKEKQEAKEAKIFAENRAQQAEKDRQEAKQAYAFAENRAQQSEKARQEAKQALKFIEIRAQQAEKERQEAKQAEAFAENKVQQAEIEVQDAKKAQSLAEKQAERAKITAEQAENRAEQAEYRAQQAERDRQEAKQAQAFAENKVQQAEIEVQDAKKAQSLAEKQAERAKITAEQAENRAEQAEYRAKQSEKDREEAKKAKILTEGKAEDFENSINLLKIKTEDLNNRNIFFTSSIEEMKNIIKKGSLREFQGLWGYSENQRVKIAELIKCIDDTPVQAKNEAHQKT
ncbi:unnamed protein product [Chironomus riparius]|uniref:GB1/RHD3-type G domain-containing protein n=1 Tax=Chironomus riparius TaxID=315576 RepID=A0A9N9WW76_9DIPT|nr:unnamed protein product [Chironomus riparius]